MADATSGTKPTPAELVGLEHAFAVDSQSDAYRPLAEAYLSLGRYMEAMVVAKAGMKAHPASPEPRILLARIYGQQGRKKKALEELDAALELGSEDVPTLLKIAGLRLENEEREGAELLLRQAAMLAPDDPAVASLAASMGVALERPKPASGPEPAPEVRPVAPTPAQVPILEPVAGRAVASNGSAPAPTAEAAPIVAAAAADPSSAGAAVEPQGPPAQPSAAPTAAESLSDGAGRRAEAGTATRPAFDPASWDFEDEEERPISPGARRQLMALVGAVVLVVLGLGGWHQYTTWQQKREEQISRLLDQTNDQLRKDTYASYKAAAELVQKILDLDSGNPTGHAYLAFINTLRWGEHGEGDDYRDAAQRSLELALKGGATEARVIAAQAYFQFFDGDPKAAMTIIEEALEAGRRSALLYGTLGTIQMWAGELDRASLNLQQAQNSESNSVRFLSALGELHRRRGMDSQAWIFYDSALRIDDDHAASLLGKALLILDADAKDRAPEDQEKLLTEAKVQIDKVLDQAEGALSTRQFALARFARAQLLFAQGQRAEAERLEQEAFTLDPRNPDIRLIRGRRLLRAGDVDGAIASIREAISIDESRAVFYVDLSKALLSKKGGAKEAVQALEAALRTAPDSGRLYVLLGDAHLAVPAVEEARKAYERGLEVEGQRLPEASAKLGGIWREKKEFAKATDEVEKALRDLGLTTSGPTLALALTERGRIFEEQPERDIQQAFERYEKAIAASDRYAPPYFFAGRILAGQRSRELQEQAIEWLEAYLRLDPGGPFAADARAALARLR